MKHKLGKNRRKRRVRRRIIRAKKFLRLSVFRSNKYIYGQVIDDVKGVTLATVTSSTIKSAKKEAKGGKLEIARQAGELLAKRAKAKKVEKVVFDRGEYRFHGRVKAFAEGAREGGLKF